MIRFYGVAQAKHGPDISFIQLMAIILGSCSFDINSILRAFIQIHPNSRETFLSAPCLSDLHLNLWPRKVVILFRGIFLIPPDDPLSKVWAFMGQVPSVVVVPIQI